MQPLGTFDLCINFAAAIGMPLIIIANLMPSVRNNARNAFLWRDHPGLMRVSMVIVGLLALWSMVRLAVHFGPMSPATADWAVLMIGIPFLIAAVAEIWLGLRLVRQWLAARSGAA